MNNLFIVDEELFDIRIDRYLSELLPDVSRSFIQKLLKNNEIYKDVYESQTEGSGDFDENGGEQ